MERRNWHGYPLSPSYAAHWQRSAEDWPALASSLVLFTANAAVQPSAVD